MTQTSPLLPTQIETVAELRNLYRAAEARAARLRLLSEAGRDLAGAEAAMMSERLEACVRRLAHFIGFPGGSIVRDPAAQGLAIHAPGEAERPVAVLVIPGFADLDDIADAEDRDAVRIHLHLLGAAIDRMDREAERSRLLDALQERERRLEFVVGRLFSAQEDERRRVSRELHDGVAQRATALFRLLEAGGHGGPAGSGAPLASIARDLVQELRELIAGLRPTILDDLGIGPAILALAAQLRAEGFVVVEDIDAGQSDWPPTVETALYRVAQEAMSNIRKHAGGPCRVEVSLHFNPASGIRRLRIRDFGNGAAVMPVTDDAGRHIGIHIGIEVMRERMTAIGGQLVWQPQSDGGVEVLATLVEGA
ncbi:histidine kinase [Sphingomonas lacunae]|uniref:histidine kinase n=1 Tax=Sphingomonas lacunae TaxID=2698828 RepID=A0A6M4AS95_9SPHN|nr:histidine kinase [Sphingomonas lacunae]QJQ31290.1 histidine kinase [Sphingomonas lacunae]